MDDRHGNLSEEFFIAHGDITLRFPTAQEAVAFSEQAFDYVLSEHEKPWFDDFEVSNKEAFVAHMTQKLLSSRSKLSEEKLNMKLIIDLRGETIGSVWIDSDRLTSHSIETSIFLLRSYQSRGLGTLVRRMVLQFAFDMLDVRRATTAVHEDNLRSIAMQEKLGYTERFRNYQNSYADSNSEIVTIEFLLEEADFDQTIDIDVLCRDSVCYLYYNTDSRGTRFNTRVVNSPFLDTSLCSHAGRAFRSKFLAALREAKKSQTVDRHSQDSVSRLVRDRLVLENFRNREIAREIARASKVMNAV